MKNILCAVLLFAALGSASAQSSFPNGGANNHGEDLCMCRGIGIPNEGNPRAQNPSDTNVVLDKQITVNNFKQHNPTELFWWRVWLMMHR